MLACVVAMFEGWGDVVLEMAEGYSEDGIKDLKTASSTWKSRGKKVGRKEEKSVR